MTETLRITRITLYWLTAVLVLAGIYALPWNTFSDGSLTIDGPTYFNIYTNRTWITLGISTAYITFLFLGTGRKPIWGAGLFALFVAITQGTIYLDSTFRFTHMDTVPGNTINPGYGAIAAITGSATLIIAAILTAHAADTAARNSTPTTTTQTPDTEYKQKRQQTPDEQPN